MSNVQLWRQNQQNELCISKKRKRAKVIMAKNYLEQRREGTAGSMHDPSGMHTGEWDSRKVLYPLSFYISRDPYLRWYFPPSVSMIARLTSLANNGWASAVHLSEPVSVAWCWIESVKMKDNIGFYVSTFNNEEMHYVIEYLKNPVQKTLTASAFGNL